MSGFRTLWFEDGALHLDLEDEIIKGCCVTHAGQVVNEQARLLLEAAAAPQAIQTEVR